MSNRKIKVAVIGVGEIAIREHIPAYKSNSCVDLVALIDINKDKAERTAKRFRINKCFSSIDELFEKQNIDAVSICTPPSTHAKIALKALGYNAHVLCEKPMATNIEDGKKMYEASKKKEKVLMIGFNHRFTPNYEKAKSLILRGRLGHIYCVEYNYLSSNPLLGWSKSPWFFNPEAGGGVLLDKGSHVFDMINYIFGDFPYAVSAQATTFLDSPVEDFCICTFEYPEERTGIGVMSWLSSQGIEQISIHGTSQSVFVSPSLLLNVNATDITEISLWRRATESLISLKFPNFPLFNNKKIDTFKLEINNFIKNILENRKFSETALNGLNVLIACDAVKKSLERKKRIGISSIKMI